MADMDSFCMGDGMVMQKGFQKSPGDNVLDTTQKYAGFLIVTFLLAVFTELIRLVRGGVLTEKEPFQAAKKLSGVMKDLVLMVLFGLQMLPAYFLMLIVMLYEPWMLFMVISGLMTGYFISARITSVYNGRRRKTEVDTGMTCDCGYVIKTETAAPENITPVTPCCCG